MKKAACDQQWTNPKKLFVHKYYDIKLIQKLNVGQVGYHSANDVIPT